MAWIPPGHSPALPARPPGSAKRSVSSDAIQGVAQRRKEQAGACGACHMRLLPLQ